MLKPTSDIIHKEPIAAIATPVGEGGISVIRVSGRDAICQRCNDISWKKIWADAASHTVHFGHIIRDKQKIDEVLVTVFRFAAILHGRRHQSKYRVMVGWLVTQQVLEGRCWQPGCEAPSGASLPSVHF